MTVDFHHDVGSVEITRRNDGRTTTLHIDRADPEVLIAASLLTFIEADPMPGVDVGEGFLRIEGTNRTVTYRLDPDGPCADCDTWQATLR